jgi:hypothetical protein
MSMRADGGTHAVTRASLLCTLNGLTRIRIMNAISDSGACSVSNKPSKLEIRVLLEVTIGE